MTDLVELMSRATFPAESWWQFLDEKMINAFCHSSVSPSVLSLALMTNIDGSMSPARGSGESPIAETHVLIS
jgi:hypothetical protein